MYVWCKWNKYKRITNNSVVVVVFLSLLAAINWGLKREVDACLQRIGGATSQRRRRAEQIEPTSQSPSPTPPSNNHRKGRGEDAASVPPTPDPSNQNGQSIELIFCLFDGAGALEHNQRRRRGWWAGEDEGGGVAGEREVSGSGGGGKAAAQGPHGGWATVAAVAEPAADAGAADSSCDAARRHLIILQITPHIFQFLKMPSKF